jgi:predicted metal-dependent enzyme (double-stranded beta helix superfamily)
MALRSGDEAGTARDAAVSIAEFAASLRDARGRCPQERALLGRVRALADAWVAGEGARLAALACEPDAEQGFGVRLLHEEPDHTLAIFVVSWAPGRGTPPHDHGTWAVVAGLAGSERNERWGRVDDRLDPHRVDLDRLDAAAIGPGDSLALACGEIHSVRNDGREVSVSLHVYGKHFNHTVRAQYDPATRTRAAYRVKVAT